VSLDLLPFLQDVITYLLDKTKAPAQEYANRVLAKLVRLVLVTVVGVSFLAAGLIFFLIAIITYLSQLMTAWLAWGIVGLITALIGSVLLLLLRR
jgi:uncharacterized membrane protein YhiD involved in acid resistance